LVHMSIVILSLEKQKKRRNEQKKSVVMKTVNENGEERTYITRNLIEYTSTCVCKIRN